MSVAAKIADNLIFADDVSDEDVKHKPILAEYIETESGKKSNSPQLLGLSGNLWLVSFKISYLCLPLFYETRTTPSCHPSGCAYRQL